MPMGSTAAALALLAAAPVAREYRTPDGVEHYVGADDDVPVEYRNRAQPVDVSHVSLNSQAAKDMEAAVEEAADARAEAKGERTISRPVSWLPGWPMFAGLTALLVTAAIVLHRLHRRRYSGNERLWRAARAATWLAGLSVFLLTVRLALPHVGRWRAQLARFGFDGLIAEEDRNSDALRRGLEKAELKAAGIAAPQEGPRPPPKPFWSGAPPPPGLLHH